MKRNRARYGLPGSMAGPPSLRVVLAHKTKGARIAVVARTSSGEVEQKARAIVKCIEEKIA